MPSNTSARLRPRRSRRPEPLALLLPLAVAMAGCPAEPSVPSMDAGPVLDVPAPRDAPMRPDTPMRPDAPDAPDAPATCAPADCDDANPCTDDVCAFGACSHVPAAGACDDGVYCNGADSCDAAGACAVHAGDPCASATTCNEPAARCDGCASASDCPGGGVVTGSCEYASSCAAEAVRTDTTYECVAGACVGTDAVVPCMRVTEGAACGTPMADDPECIPHSTLDPCDGAGDRYVTTVTPICRAGACVPEMTAVLEDCTRPTEGEPCGGGCLDWTECMQELWGFCGGMRLRDCVYGTCVAGACDSRWVAEVEACAVPDGTTCLIGGTCSDCLPGNPTSCPGSGACHLDCWEDGGDCVAGTCVATGAVLSPRCEACECPP